MTSMTIVSRSSVMWILGLALCAGMAWAEPPGQPAPGGGAAVKTAKAKGASAQAPEARTGTMAMRDEAYWERRLQSQRHRLEGIGLTDAQRREIDALPARQAAWYRENGPRLDALRDEIREAQKANDQASLTKLGAERQRLVEQRPTMDSILTDGQRVRMYQQGRKQAEAAAKARAAGGGKRKSKRAAEIKALRKQMVEARDAGDMDRVKELQAELRALRRPGKKGESDDEASDDPTDASVSAKAGGKGSGGR
jgi:hypothetical protein